MRRTITKVRVISIVGLLSMISCVEPYNPPSGLTNINYLVVDGFLNATLKSATVKLNRAIPLNASFVPPPETGATVTVEAESGANFSLAETNDGVYTADNLTLDPSSGYRVRVDTRGTSYTSDFISIRQSPVLDSVTWRPEATGIRFFVNGHDPARNTTFYRYLFSETWEYRVPIKSDFMIIGGEAIFRNEAHQVYTCWKSATSTEILTTSTKQLSEDVVSMFPVNFIPKGSRLLSRTYSMNIQQRAISQAEYEYWNLIRKTTESLGGLFDPLPSQVSGNVHNDNDASEQVLGYFSGGFVNEKRIFVTFNDLPNGYQRVDGYDFTCDGWFVPINDLGKVGNGVLVVQIGQPPIGYTAAPPNCADCTSLGGNNVKPDFWPN